MGIIFGSARIDENGNIAGGSSGDQTGREVSTQPYYMHSQGWYCLRPKSVSHAAALAFAMSEACANDNIGYDQNQRNGIITMLRKYGSLGKIAEKCEADCSSLVRACIIQATGKDVGDIYTGNLASALENSRLFDSRFGVTSEGQLYNGDVLVTKTKGHTVIVVSGKTRQNGTAEPPGAWKAIGTATSIGDDVNVRRTPNGEIIGKLNKGNRFEVDGTLFGEWVHVKVARIGVGYVHKSWVKYDGTKSTGSWEAIGTAICTGNGVNVRSAPSMSGTILGKLNYGNRFEVDGQKSGDWIHIKVAGFGVGYISKNYVKYD